MRDSSQRPVARIPRVADGDHPDTLDSPSVLAGRVIFRSGGATTGKRNEQGERSGNGNGNQSKNHAAGNDQDVLRAQKRFKGAEQVLVARLKRFRAARSQALRAVRMARAAQRNVEAGRDDAGLLLDAQKQAAAARAAISRLRDEQAPTVEAVIEARNALTDLQAARQRATRCNDNQKGQGQHQKLDMAGRNSDGSHGHGNHDQHHSRNSGGGRQRQGISKA
jgi:hypothetical protein